LLNVFDETPVTLSQVVFAKWLFGIPVVDPAEMLNGTEYRSRISYSHYQCCQK